MFVVLNSSEIVFFLFTLHLSQRINKDVIIFIIIFIITINFFFFYQLRQVRWPPMTNNIVLKKFKILSEVFLSVSKWSWFTFDVLLDFHTVRNALF